MKREKTSIAIGQIWRDKRDHARVIRVTNLFVGKAPGGGKPAIRVEYEYTSGQARKNARPVAESCFRGDYEPYSINVPSVPELVYGFILDE